MSTFRTLLAPLGYLRAKNHHKYVWDWIYPALVAVVVVILVCVLPKPVPILGAEGLTYWVNQLLQILVGFYIAALAAVSSFERPALDQFIEGDGVRLAVLRDGEVIDKQLTRRAFLSLMFGYLSLLAIFLYCIGVLVNLFSSNIHLLPNLVLIVFRFVFIAGYVFLVCQMLTVTLVGLFYLSDRIHRLTPFALPPEEIKPPQGDQGNGR